MNTHDTTETHIHIPNFEDDVFHESIEQENDDLLVHVTQRKPLPPGHVHRLLSDSSNPSTATTPDKDNTTSFVNNTSTKCIALNGIKYRSISNLNVVYCHSHAITNKSSLVDYGANGGLCGTYARLIEKTDRSVDIQGIYNH